MRPRKFSSRFGSGDVAFNMTPMIDVTFQLIIFFILASQMASGTLAKVDLPRPYRSAAVAHARSGEDKVIVNVLRDAAGGAVYKIEGRSIAAARAGELREILAGRRAAGQGPLLEVRADRRAPYAAVAPVLDAAARAGYTRMNITALLEAGAAP
jgi:biopolymer transport protein ExbD